MTDQERIDLLNSVGEAINSLMKISEDCESLFKSVKRMTEELLELSQRIEQSNQRISFEFEDLYDHNLDKLKDTLIDRCISVLNDAPAKIKNPQIMLKMPGRMTLDPVHLNGGSSPTGHAIREDGDGIIAMFPALDVFAYLILDRLLTVK